PRGPEVRTHDRPYDTAPTSLPRFPSGRLMLPGDQPYNRGLTPPRFLAPAPDPTAELQNLASGVRGMGSGVARWLGASPRYPFDAAREAKEVAEVWALGARHADALGVRVPDEPDVTSAATYRSALRRFA